MSDLLIGAGRNRDVKVIVDGKREWNNLTTLDINPEVEPDVVWDLTNIPLPFPDNSFDTIHCYEVLEHIGVQGDYKFFFAQFTDFHRILKPNGLIIGSVPHPSSPWAWGDPSHTRVIPPENFVFLDQRSYEEQVGHTAMTDFRYLYKVSFTRMYVQQEDQNTVFVLRAIK